MAKLSDLLGSDLLPRTRLAVELSREVDGRWIADVPQLPGVLAYGATRDEAIAKADALAERVLAERVLAGEPSPMVRR